MRMYGKVHDPVEVWMKKTAVKLSAVLLALLVFLGGFQPVRAEADFDAFLEEKFREAMESDYTGLHFGFVDYKGYGLKKPEVKWPDISYASIAEEQAAAQKTLDELHQFSYDSLNDRQQHDYLAYEHDLMDTIALDAYPDYEEVYNPYGGYFSDVQTLLTEFVLYDKESAEDYLTLTEDYVRLMDVMNEFTKQQAAKGYFMRDAALDEALKQMREFVDKGEENPLIVIYSNSIDQLEGLTDEERTSFRDRNRDLVLNKVFPAVENAMKVLESLRGSRSVDGSLYYYPEGKEYYKALVARKTSSSDSVEEVKEYLGKALKDIYAFAVGTGLTASEGADVTTGLETPEEVLEYLRSHMKDFPPGPAVTYTPSYLDQSVANPAVMAYYMDAPFDDVTRNVIRINGNAVAGDPVTLYYTLAHEGFPGHLYQMTWYHSQDINPMRYNISAIGYTEGWAQYVEKIMLDRSPLTENSADSAFANTFLGYVMQAYADLCVNGLGYDAQQLADDMASLGLFGMDAENLKPVYEAVVDQAGTIIPYGYGMCRFWEFNERTKQALGDKFNLEEFHLTVLTNGPRPFESVESDLAKYVESKGKKLPEKFTFFSEKAGSASAIAGKMLLFVTTHLKEVMIAAVIVVILLLVVLVLILRALFKWLFGRKKRKEAAPV